MSATRIVAEVKHVVPKFILTTIDPDDVYRAMRAAGLDPDRLDITPGIDDGDEAHGNLVLASLLEVAKIFAHISPDRIGRCTLMVAIGDSRADPVWCDGFLPGTVPDLYGASGPQATLRVRNDLLEAELAGRLERIRRIAAGRE